ncbi:MAG: hypothetical protein M3Z02_11805 [Actinomycetota bacterium]|nr:hypothetical protein [Actinomycetota bacterium]
MAATAAWACAAGRRLLTCLALVLGALALAVPAASATQLPDPVPTFACAATNADGTFTYFFGYDLAGTTPVTSKVGANQGTNNNLFTPAPADRGQPTTFAPGSHPNAVSVTTSATTLTWTLHRTDAVGTSSQLCNNPPVVAESPAALVLPTAAMAPFLVWFTVHRRRARHRTAG